MMCYKKHGTNSSCVGAPNYSGTVNIDSDLTKTRRIFFYGKYFKGY